MKIAEQIIDCLPTKDRVAIIAYNTKVKELSPFTTDKRQLKSVLKDIGQNGDRSFEEARKYAQTLLNQEDTDREKCVVVLSDSIWGMYVSVGFSPLTNIMCFMMEKFIDLMWENMNVYIIYLTKKLMTMFRRN